MGQLAANGLEFLTFVLKYMVSLLKLRRCTFSASDSRPRVHKDNPVPHFTASVEGDNP